MPDRIFKALFSHWRMAELLIRRHLPRWAGRLDFSTLAKAPTEMVVRGHTVRLMDLAWACRSANRGEELLLLLEFQGRLKPDMARRTDLCRNLALTEWEARHRGPAGPAPEIRARAFVLFHGDGAWTAPTHAPELHGPGASEVYLLVVPRPLGQPDPELLDLPELMLGLARSLSPAQMATELELCARVVEMAADEELDRAVDAAARRLLAWRGLPDALWNRGRGMHEAVKYFQRGMEDLTRKGRMEGRAEGLREGRTEGMRVGRTEGLRMGRRALLRRQAARRFGADAAREFGDLLERVDDPERLDAAGDAIIDCDEAEALLSRARDLTTA